MRYCGRHVVSVGLPTERACFVGTATTAKKAPLPDPLYVYCTVFLLADHEPVERPNVPGGNAGETWMLGLRTAILGQDFY